MSEKKYKFSTDIGGIPPELFIKHSGIELFEMMLTGDVPQPPIAKVMNFHLAEAEKGRVVFRGTPKVAYYNPLGSVHGGWPATILDSAMSCAVQTMLPAGMLYTTAEFKVNLIRPLFEDTGEVICEGNIIHCGRTIATSSATIKTQEGKLIAHGTATCAIFPFKMPDA